MKHYFKFQWKLQLEKVIRGDFNVNHHFVDEVLVSYSCSSICETQGDWNCCNCCVMSSDEFSVWCNLWSEQYHRRFSIIEQFSYSSIKLSHSKEYWSSFLAACMTSGSSTGKNYSGLVPVCYGRLFTAKNTRESLARVSKRQGKSSNTRL